MQVVEEGGETKIGPGWREWGPEPGLRTGLGTGSLSSVSLASLLHVGSARPRRDASTHETVECCQGRCSRWALQQDWGSSGHRSSLCPSRRPYVIGVDWGRWGGTLGDPGNSAALGALQLQGWVFACQAATYRLPDDGDVVCEFALFPNWTQDEPSIQDLLLCRDDHQGGQEPVVQCQQTQQALNLSTADLHCSTAGTSGRKTPVQTPI